MADEPTLAFLRGLARTDEEVAAALGELDALAAKTEDVRARAAELDQLSTRLPAERERLTAAADEAVTELARRTEAHQRAGAELAAAERGRDKGRLAAARRAEVRARDLVAMARRRLDATEADRARLEAEAETAERDSRAVVARSREVAAVLAERGGLAEGAGEPPAATLESVARWATNARAALLVARSRLAAERDAVIRQANEVGASVLGEPLAAQSAALVARRVEQAQGP
jgi:hypothetical protein